MRRRANNLLLIAVSVAIIPTLVAGISLSIVNKSVAKSGVLAAKGR